MEILGLHHVNVNVHALHEAVTFYVTGLGCKELPRPDLRIDGAWLQLGSHELHLMVNADALIDRSQHFAVAVSDIEVYCQHLDSLGIAYSRATAIAGVTRQVFLRDPSGNRLELNLVS